jgi:hypothetical protein
MGQLDDHHQLWVSRGWTSVYIALIALLVEAVALTAFGLVQPVGREVPRWVPIFGGKGVRPAIVFRTAAMGSVALTLIWTAGFWSVWTGHRQSNMASEQWQAVFTACYAPLNLWGPALLALALAYRRRANAR